MFLLSCHFLLFLYNCSMGLSQNAELMAQSVENLEIGTLAEIEIPRWISCQPQVLSNTAMLEKYFQLHSTTFSQMHLSYQHPSQLLIQWIELDELFARKRSDKQSGTTFSENLFHHDNLVPCHVHRFSHTLDHRGGDDHLEPCSQTPGSCCMGSRKLTAENDATVLHRGDLLSYLFGRHQRSRGMSFALWSSLPWDLLEAMVSGRCDSKGFEGMMTPNVWHNLWKVFYTLRTTEATCAGSRLTFSKLPRFQLPTTKF